MNLTEEIKSLIFDYIDEEYKKYLNSNGILLIKKENINKIINNLYDNNNKNIKSLIRKSIKEKYMNDYPSGTVENMIFDIFQDKDLNINKITDELNFIQKKNYKELEIPIINNSLNLNISIVGNYIIINSVNKSKIEEHKELYNMINEYKFIYSINDTILEELNNEEKIKRIKEEIKDKDHIKVALYYLKENRGKN
jgi:hypothetical protein